MAIVQTTKHEMAYDTETGRVIFNGRNKTAALPVQDAFPQRLITAVETTQEEEDDTDE